MTRDWPCSGGAWKWRNSETAKRSRECAAWIDLRRLWRPTGSRVPISTPCCDTNTAFRSPSVAARCSIPQKAAGTRESGPINNGNCLKPEDLRGFLFGVGHEFLVRAFEVFYLAVVK